MDLQWVCVQRCKRFIAALSLEWTSMSKSLARRYVLTERRNWYWYWYRRRRRCRRVSVCVCGSTIDCCGNLAIADTQTDGRTDRRTRLLPDVGSVFGGCVNWPMHTQLRPIVHDASLIHCQQPALSTHRRKLRGGQGDSGDRPPPFK